MNQELIEQYFRDESFKRKYWKIYFIAISLSIIEALFIYYNSMFNDWFARLLLITILNMILVYIGILKLKKNIMLKIG